LRARSRRNRAGLVGRALARRADAARRMHFTRCFSSRSS
jgi:hypothetical protein